MNMANKNTFKKKKNPGIRQAKTKKINSRKVLQSLIENELA